MGALASKARACKASALVPARDAAGAKLWTAWALPYALLSGALVASSMDLGLSFLLISGAEPKPMPLDRALDQCPPPADRTLD